MLEKAIEKFNEYTSNYDMNIMEINLKYHHSFAVMDLMGELAFRLGFDKEKLEIAKLIGLLHDIGRFEQFAKYNKLDDSVSNHAEESVVYLFDENHIRDFIEDDKYDEIIKTAIKYHNKLEIPNDLNDKELLFTKMIRDMDKVDIYKQLAVNYEFSFKADEVTEEILKLFQQEKCIDLKDRKTESDMKVSFIPFFSFISILRTYVIIRFHN